MNILEQFRIASSVYNTLIQEHSDEIIKELIKEIGVEHNGLTCGAIIGYTPGFNDGDACEHSTYFVLDNEIAEHEFFESLDIEEEDFEYNQLTRAEERNISVTLNSIDVILEEKHGTNYRFLFAILDGEIKTHFEDYDCGY